ncbi:AI-2E family transporter [Oceanicaulis sp. MMSF_3324]|uniref:AI-2E family transporter n=1 Tax=Oceanicaulis sp. MMSF_3324 TaxID=3046702 RepID=UPI00273EA514|nr:AI-2E family transporter [Oceanicaulis sp. MMSF_3324]
MTDDTETDDASNNSNFSALMSDRQALQRVFIVLLALGISIIFIWMIRGFLSPLFMAAVFAMFLNPVHRFLKPITFGSSSAAAGVVLVLAVVGVLIPLTAILAIVADQAVQVTGAVAPWLQDQIRGMREGGMDAFPQWLPFRDSLAPYQQEITNQAGQFASNIGGWVVDGLRKATSGTFGAFLDLVVLLFALFFFLTRGPQLASHGLKLMPMPSDDRELLVERAISTIRATVKGTFVIAIIQGAMTGVALAIAGVPGALFLATLTAVLSVIPGIGPPLVWGPAGLWLIASGNYWAGGLLIAWGAIVVGLTDNLLRPSLVGKDAKLPDLMILISTLGGLTLFGAIGLIVGPMIAALFSSIWYLYAQSYAPLLSEDHPEELKD